jgi:1,6-anhydro-N-acetylmuramate kinase
LSGADAPVVTMPEQKRRPREIDQQVGDAIRALGHVPVEDMKATLSAAWTAVSICQSVSQLLAKLYRNDTSEDGVISGYIDDSGNAYHDAAQWAEVMVRALRGSTSLPEDIEPVSIDSAQLPSDPLGEDEVTELVNAMMDLGGALNIICGWARGNATLEGDKRACATVSACGLEFYRAYEGRNS